MRLPRVRALRVADGKAVVVDGTTGDEVWSRARWTEIDVADPIGKVKIKAAYDAEHIYLLALWNDEDVSLNRYWKRTGTVQFERYAREDGFAVLWAPGSDADAFAEKSCALYCHDGTHAIAASHRNVKSVDVWYWGAQQTGPMMTLRDMALRGGADRLRGDGQPERSDNIENRSAEFEGPRYFPLFVNPGSTRILRAKNLTEVKRSTLEEKIPKARGREVPLEIVRERKGSRGDVRAKARHVKGKGWVLEMGRLLNTGHSDDQPLAPDPLVTTRFAIAIYDDAGSGEHATSGPIELVFVASE